MFERLKRRFHTQLAPAAGPNPPQPTGDRLGDRARALQQRDLGIALARSGKFAEALRELKLAMEIDAQDALTWLELGYVFKDSLHLNEALATFRDASTRFAKEPRFLNGQALVLRDLGRLEEALAILRQAQQIDPMHAGSVSNAVLIEIALGHYDAALRDAERAVRISPELLQAHLTLMTAQLLTRQIDQAMASAELIAAWPENGPQSAIARSTALQELGREPEALATLLGAIEDCPQDATLTSNAALIALRLEQFAKGWALHETRLQLPGASTAVTQSLAKLTPEDDLRFVRVFVYAEQGIGDSIQFMRYVPQLMARGAHVTLGLPALLEPLYAGNAELGDIAGPGAIPAQTTHHAALLSLPFILGDEGHHPPPFAPRIDAKKVAAFAQRLGDPAKLRIGLAVSGNRNHQNDANRSIPLALVASLAFSENQIVLLQKDLRASDRAAAQQMQVLDLSSELHDFSDTAALAACCDLVVSVDSAPAHLAGSLGVPLYLLLPHLADWRWRRSTTRTPWYPSAKLFRQDASRDWGFVIAHLLAELEQGRASLLSQRAVVI